MEIPFPSPPGDEKDISRLWLFVLRLKNWFLKQPWAGIVPYGCIVPYQGDMPYG